MELPYGVPTEIELPEDSDLIRGLRLKLKEYKGRLEQEIAEYSRIIHYPPPEMIDAKTPTPYKIKILEKLFEEGHIDVSKYGESLEEKTGHLVRPHYFESIVIIHDYCTTGGENVTPPTGF